MMFKFGLLFILMWIVFGANAHNWATPEEIENISSGTYNILENNSFKIQGNDINATFLERAIGKYGDTMFFIGASAMKESINYGYNNPNEAYKYVMWFVFLSILAPLIIPLIYIIGFLCVGASLISDKLNEYNKTKVKKMSWCNDRKHENIC